MLPDQLLLPDKQPLWDQPSKVSRQDPQLQSSEAVPKGFDICFWGQLITLYEVVAEEPKDFASEKFLAGVHELQKSATQNDSWRCNTHKL